MGFIAKSDVTICGGAVRKEGGVVVDHDVGSAGIGTTLVIILDCREEWAAGLLELLLCKVADGGGNVRRKLAAPPAATGGGALPIR